MAIPGLWCSETSQPWLQINFFCLCLVWRQQISEILRISCLFCQKWDIAIKQTLLEKFPTLFTQLETLLLCCVMHYFSDSPVKIAKGWITDYLQQTIVNRFRVEQLPNYSNISHHSPDSEPYSWLPKYVNAEVVFIDVRWETMLTTAVFSIGRCWHNNNTHLSSVWSLRWRAGMDWSGNTQWFLVLTEGELMQIVLINSPD